MSDDCRVRTADRGFDRQILGNATSIGCREKAEPTFVVEQNRGAPSIVAKADPYVVVTNNFQLLVDLSSWKGQLNGGTESDCYMPGGIDKDLLLAKVVETLSLTVDFLPPEKKFSFEYSAQFREQGKYLLIEYSSDLGFDVEELSEWEMPTAEYKSLLSGSRSSITIVYRGIEYAKTCLAIISDVVGDAKSRCIIDNDYGCLLKLSDVTRCIASDPTWTWEREEFLEIPGVAPSEWRDAV